MGREYTSITINLPKEIVDEILKIIEEHPEMEYGNVEEFVMGSVKDSLKKIRKFEKRARMEEKDI